MTRLGKEPHTLLIDRNRDEGFVRMCGIALFLSPAELRVLSRAAWRIAVEIERKPAELPRYPECEGR